MRYFELPPPADLAADVHCLWELDGDATAFGEPVFPDGRVEIVLHLGAPPTRVGAPGPQPRIMIAGQMTSAVRLTATERVHVVGIRFTPAGARRWLEAPQHEFTDRFLSLDDIRADLARSLEFVAGERQPLDHLHRVLRTSERRVPRESFARRAAIAATTRSGGIVTVEKLAACAGVSRRQIERLFLDGVGVGPKTFQRTVRLQRALGALRSGLEQADVAAACGYADQSHLSREIARVAGQRPGAIDYGCVAFLSA
jgi:AraC-like DNA-binding protein